MDLAIIFIGAVASLGIFAFIAKHAGQYSDGPRVGAAAMQRVKHERAGVPAE